MEWLPTPIAIERSIRNGSYTSKMVEKMGRRKLASRSKVKEQDEMQSVASFGSPTSRSRSSSSSRSRNPSSGSPQKNVRAKSAPSPVDPNSIRRSLRTRKIPPDLPANILVNVKVEPIEHPELEVHEVDLEEDFAMEESFDKPQNLSHDSQDDFRQASNELHADIDESRSAPFEGGENEDQETQLVEVGLNSETGALVLVSGPEGRDSPGPGIYGTTLVLSVADGGYILADESDLWLGRYSFPHVFPNLDPERVEATFVGITENDLHTLPRNANLWRSLVTQSNIIDQYGKMYDTELHLKQRIIHLSECVSKTVHMRTLVERELTKLQSKIGPLERENQALQNQVTELTAERDRRDTLHSAEIKANEQKSFHEKKFSETVESLKSARDVKVKELELILKSTKKELDAVEKKSKKEKFVLRKKVLQLVKKDFGVNRKWRKEFAILHALLLYIRDFTPMEQHQQFFNFFSSKDIDSVSEVENLWKKVKIGINKGEFSVESLDSLYKDLKNKRQLQEADLKKELLQKVRDCFGDADKDIHASDEDSGAEPGLPNNISALRTLDTKFENISPLNPVFNWDSSKFSKNITSVTNLSQNGPSSSQRLAALSSTGLSGRGKLISGPTPRGRGRGRGRPRRITETEKDVRQDISVKAISNDDVDVKLEQEDSFQDELGSYNLEREEKTKKTKLTKSRIKRKRNVESETSSSEASNDSEPELRKRNHARPGLPAVKGLLEDSEEEDEHIKNKPFVSVRVEQAPSASFVSKSQHISETKHSTLSSSDEDENGSINTLEKPKLTVPKAPIGASNSEDMFKGLRSDLSLSDKSDSEDICGNDDKICGPEKADSIIESDPDTIEPLQEGDVQEALTAVKSDFLPTPSNDEGKRQKGKSKKSKRKSTSSARKKGKSKSNRRKIISGYGVTQNELVKIATEFEESAASSRMMKLSAFELSVKPISRKAGNKEAGARTVRKSHQKVAPVESIPISPVRKSARIAHRSDPVDPNAWQVPVHLQIKSQTHNMNVLSSLVPDENLEKSNIEENHQEVFSPDTKLVSPLCKDPILPTNAVANQKSVRDRLGDPTIPIAVKKSENSCLKSRLQEQISSASKKRNILAAHDLKDTSTQFAEPPAVKLNSEENPTKHSLVVAATDVKCLSKLSKSKVTPRNMKIAVKNLLKGPGKVAPRDEAMEQLRLSDQITKAKASKEKRSVVFEAGNIVRKTSQPSESSTAKSEVKQFANTAKDMPQASVDGIGKGSRKRKRAPSSDDIGDAEPKPKKPTTLANSTSTPKGSEPQPLGFNSTSLNQFQQMPTGHPFHFPNSNMNPFNQAMNAFSGFGNGVNSFMQRQTELPSNQVNAQGNLNSSEATDNHERNQFNHNPHLNPFMNPLYMNMMFNPMMMYMNGMIPHFMSNVDPLTQSPSNPVQTSNPGVTPGGYLNSMMPGSMLMGNNMMPGSMLMGNNLMPPFGFGMGNSATNSNVSINPNTSPNLLGSAMSNKDSIQALKQIADIPSGEPKPKRGKSTSVRLNDASRKGIISQTNFKPAAAEKRTPKPKAKSMQEVTVAKPAIVSKANPKQKKKESSTTTPSKRVQRINKKKPTKQLDLPVFTVPSAKVPPQKEKQGSLNKNASSNCSPVPEKVKGHSDQEIQENRTEDASDDGSSESESGRLIIQENAQDLDESSNTETSEDEATNVASGIRNPLIMKADVSTGANSNGLREYGIQQSIRQLMMLGKPNNVNVGSTRMSSFKPSSSRKRSHSGIGSSQKSPDLTSEEETAITPWTNQDTPSSPCASPTPHESNNISTIETVPKIHGFPQDMTKFWECRTAVVIHHQVNSKTFDELQNTQKLAPEIQQLVEDQAPPSYTLASALHKAVEKLDHLDDIVPSPRDSSEPPLRLSDHKVLLMVEKLSFYWPKLYGNLPNEMLNYFRDVVLTQPHCIGTRKQTDVYSIMKNFGRFYGSLCRKFCTSEAFKQLIYDCLCRLPFFATTIVYGLLCSNNDCFSMLPAKFDYDKVTPREKLMLFALQKPIDHAVNRCASTTGLRSMLTLSLMHPAFDCTWDQMLLTSLDAMNGLESQYKIDSYVEGISMLFIQCSWHWLGQFLRKHFTEITKKWTQGEYNTATLAGFLSALGKACSQTKDLWDLDYIGQEVANVTRLAEDLKLNDGILQGCISDLTLRLRQKQAAMANQIISNRHSGYMRNIGKASINGHNKGRAKRNRKKKDKPKQMP